ncbi:hypothetical protein Fmac_016595 [Flemingia macrophylla]|uniref:Uncharacterized protein n=1 Tax=Flemingia macrophylla TaxID=520843 RepID=A0ABD1MHV9_9FABA
MIKFVFPPSFRRRIHGKADGDTLSPVLPAYCFTRTLFGSWNDAWWLSSVAARRCPACRCCTADQCSDINRFVALLSVSLLSFHFTIGNNPYAMNYRFIAADSLQMGIVLGVLLLPLLKGLYGDASDTLLWTIRDCACFASMERDVAERTKKQGVFLLQCAVKWFLTSYGRRR